jgi:hypothetical protein
MSAENGKASVYLNATKIADVDFRVAITTGRIGKQKITGTIEVLGDGPEFTDPSLVYVLETNNGKHLPFWVINPHPLEESRIYRVAIIPE